MSPSPGRLAGGVMTVQGLSWTSPTTSHSLLLPRQPGVHAQGSLHVLVLQTQLVHLHAMPLLQRLPLALQLPGLFTGHPGCEEAEVTHRPSGGHPANPAPLPHGAKRTPGQGTSPGTGQRRGGLQVTPGWALAEETWTTAGYLARDGFGLGTAIQEGCSGGKGDGPRRGAGNCP